MKRKFSLLPFIFLLIISVFFLFFIVFLFFENNIISEISTTYFTSAIFIVLLVLFFLFLLSVFLLFYFRNDKKGLLSYFFSALIELISIILLIIPLTSFIKVINSYGTFSFLNAFNFFTFSSPGPTLRFDYFINEKESYTINVYYDYSLKDKPYIIYYHGGLFCYGNADEDYLLFNFLKGQGYVIFSINYPLSNQNQSSYEKDLLALNKANEFINNKVVEYSLNLNRFYVITNDAGSNLYIRYLLENINKTGFNIPKKLALISPLINVKETYLEGNLITKRAPNKELINYLPLEKMDDINLLNYDYPSSFPNNLIINGEKDSLTKYKTASSFNSFLLEKNISSNIIGLPFDNHHFNHPNFSLTLEAYKNILAGYLI